MLSHPGPCLPQRDGSSQGWPVSGDKKQLAQEDFPGGSDGKASDYNAGGPGSIPGLGRSSGEGNGNPLQYFWVSLVAQLVRNLPAMQEARVPSRDREDPLEKGKATHSSILAWRIPWTA